jgi:hypothetical protein
VLLYGFQCAFLLRIEPEDSGVCVDRAPGKVNSQLSLAHPSQTVEGDQVLTFGMGIQPFLQLLELDIASDIFFLVDSRHAA